MYILIVLRSPNKPSITMQPCILHQKFKQTMQKPTSPPVTNELQEIRKNLMEKNNPTMFQRMLHATTRIREGRPTMDDYRLVMQWPAMAGMFMRRPTESKPPQE